MTDIIHHQNGNVLLEPAGDGRVRVSVSMADPGAFVSDPAWTTGYPRELIDAILKVKGPAWLCDEIRRDEDPAYVENDFRHDVLGFISPDDFRGKRVLDFGCGCGASTVVVSRILPGVEITGVELDAPSLEIAKMRAAYYRLRSTRFLLSPDPESLPPDIGDFHFILLSAVYEHLLPDERIRLLPQIWARLRPGGILFLNQTPHRYFPIEGHTTGLPLINYLPDRLAHFVVGRFCRRVPRDADWVQLLRQGIRGGTAGEVLNILRGTGEKARSLIPARNGLSNHLDLWDRSSRVRHSGLGHRMKICALKFLRSVTGLTLVPNISLGIMKEGQARRGRT